MSFLGLDIDVNKYMGHLELTDISKKSVSFHGNYGDIKSPKLNEKTLRDCGYEFIVLNLRKMYKYL